MVRILAAPYSRTARAAGTGGVGGSGSGGSDAEPGVEPGEYQEHRARAPAWVVLWSAPSKKKAAAPHQARAFSPKIAPCGFATDLLRLEFNHRDLDYYAQFDAVELRGTPYTEARGELVLPDLQAAVRTAAAVKAIYRRLSSSDLINPAVQSRGGRGGSALESRRGNTGKLMALVASTSTRAGRRRSSSGSNADTAALPEGKVVDSSGVDADGGGDGDDDAVFAASRPDKEPACSNPFDTLADELVLCVFEALDFIDLLRCACVSRRFFALGYRMHLGFAGLDLQRYWMRVTDGFLHSIVERCTNMQRLSLSWSGGGQQNLLSTAGFQSFISTAGAPLVCLRLACCTFLTDDCIRTVVGAAPLLEDIDLQCCSNVSPAGIDCLTALTRLKRLNLYNSQVTTYAAVRIAEACAELEHLDLGQCSDILNWDATLILVVSKASKLKSLNLWRARTLTHAGVLHIAQHCPLLESLDMGWCRMINADECIPQLTERCVNLRKLFLTAIRSTSSLCVESLVKHSSRMEQLDVVGSNSITVPAITAVIQSCTALVYLDISFCRFISDEAVEQLRKDAPHVSIKSSLQNNENA